MYPFSIRLSSNTTKKTLAVLSALLLAGCESMSDEEFLELPEKSIAIINSLLD